MTQLKIAIGGLLIVGFGLSAHAQEVNGVMMVVKGDIKVTSGKDKTTEGAKVGKKVFAGDSIVAGPDSRAKIVMSDKNVLNISPDSKLIIEKYTNDGTNKNVELNVQYGKVRASVEQKYDGEKSKFNIKTPSAVAGVRGTDFITGYNASTKASQIITFSGTVAVGKPGPGGAILNPVFVKPGQMTNVGSGGAPEAPKAMPKEELNRMNNDSKADTSANKQEQPAKDQGQAKNDKDKDKDKAKNEGDKGKPEQDQARGEGDKGKNEGNKDNGKNDQGPRSADGGAPGGPGSPDAPGMAGGSGSPDAPGAPGGPGSPDAPGMAGGPDGKRGPASEGGPSMAGPGGGPGAPGMAGPGGAPAMGGSMIGADLLGPGMATNMPMNPAAGGGMPMPIFMPPPPNSGMPGMMPPTNTFIDGIPKNTNVIINITK